ncbi:hypothetical protein DFH09DRAFT_1310413 [Mycena vulgaris]|nr:hypothetical protein DFH09DRAFT_1310413 [Mycena vulgaris]
MEACSAYQSRAALRVVGEERGAEEVYSLERGAFLLPLFCSLVLVFPCLLYRSRSPPRLYLLLLPPKSLPSPAIIPNPALLLLPPFLPTPFGASPLSFLFLPRRGVLPSWLIHIHPTRILPSPFTFRSPSFRPLCILVPNPQTNAPYREPSIECCARAIGRVRLSLRALARHAVLGHRARLVHAPTLYPQQQRRPSDIVSGGPAVLVSLRFGPALDRDTPRGVAVAGRASRARDDERTRATLRWAGAGAGGCAARNPSEGGDDEGVQVQER